MKILICEDNVMARKIMGFFLQKKGFEVLSAVDGLEGINILKEERVDLIITDINMPFNSGLELIQFIRSQFKFKIPVIIVSIINTESAKAHALELGADRYLTKPFDPEALMEAIESLNILKKSL